jgi:hypothetical protein
LNSGRQIAWIAQPSAQSVQGATMPKPKLSPEGEVIITSYGAAMVAAFQVLHSSLEENDAVQPGQFPAARAVYFKMVKSRKGDVSNMTLAVLHDIHMATLY